MQETYKFETRDKYLEALDSVLPENYIQKRSTGNSIHHYIPAAIKEAIADDIFHYWNVIDEKYEFFANQVIYTVKLIYMPDYPDAQEHFCTGSASAPLGEAKNSLEYKIPSTRMESIANAMQTLGNIFGRNIQRKINKDTNLPTNFTIRKHEPRTEQEKK